MKISRNTLQREKCGSLFSAYENNSARSRFQRKLLKIFWEDIDGFDCGLNPTASNFHEKIGGCYGGLIRSSRIPQTVPNLLKSWTIEITLPIVFETIFPTRHAGTAINAETELDL